MSTLITSENLEAGIRFWLDEKSRQQYPWPRDFHNHFYQRMAYQRRNGLTLLWWSRTVDELWEWRAIRPLSKLDVYRLGVIQLAQFQTAYDQAASSGGDGPVNLETARWENLDPLFRLASDIKSDGFASKFCHFLLPDAYPVADREVVGFTSGRYEDHWRYCQTEWANCTTKPELVQILQRKIGSAVIPDYPYSTKITELCLIGRGGHAKQPKPGTGRLAGIVPIDVSGISLNKPST